MQNARQHGCWQGGTAAEAAEAEFKAFVEQSNIPAAWTILGVSAIATDHPLNVGMVGMHGNYGPNMLTNECDVLIAIGMRFDDRVTGDLSKYAKQAKIIHLELDPAEVDKNVKVDVALLSDCKITLKELNNRISAKTYPEWIARFEALDKIGKLKLSSYLRHWTRVLPTLRSEKIKIITCNYY